MLTFSLPVVYPCCVINISLPFITTFLLIWQIEASGWTWHVELLELGLWPRTPSYILTRRNLRKE
jgi:hypothetical protein